MMRILVKTLGAAALTFAGVRIGLVKPARRKHSAALKRNKKRHETEAAKNFQERWQARQAALAELDANGITDSKKRFAKLIETDKPFNRRSHELRNERAEADKAAAKKLRKRLLGGWLDLISTS